MERRCGPPRGFAANSAVAPRGTTDGDRELEEAARDHDQPDRRSGRRGRPRAARGGLHASHEPRGRPRSMAQGGLLIPGGDRAGPARKASDTLHPMKTRHAVLVAAALAIM